MEIDKALKIVLGITTDEPQNTQKQTVTNTCARKITLSENNKHIIYRKFPKNLFIYEEITETLFIFFKFLWKKKTDTKTEWIKRHVNLKTTFKISFYIDIKYNLLVINTGKVVRLDNIL